jgi:hypothetical protein
MGKSNYDKNKNFRWMLASSWATRDVVEFRTTAAYKSLGQSIGSYNKSNQLVVKGKGKAIPLQA